MKHTQHQETQKRKKPLTKQILQAILHKVSEEGGIFVEALSLFLKYPHALPSVARRLQDNDAFWERKRILRAIRDLERKKLILIRKTGQRLLLALTNTGKTTLLQEQICRAPSCAPNECVIVIFDIPETQRYARLLFRRFLQECNFERLQQSVWASTRAVLPHLRQFIKHQGIEQWVSVFIGRDALQKRK